MKESFYVGSPPKKPEDFEKNNFGETSPSNDKESTKPEGDFSEITLVEPVAVREERISFGGYSDVFAGIYKVVENGKEILLVKKVVRNKRFKEKFKEKIQETFEIHNLLTEAGIPTLDLYTDGESLYSPLLNQDGIVALSGNNGAPVSHSSESEEKLVSGKFEIENLPAIFESILDIAVKSEKVGVFLPWDCLFFLVKKSTEDEDLEQHMKVLGVIVGDFDWLRRIQKIKSLDILSHLIKNITDFIEEYATKSLKSKYLQEIQDKLNPTVERDQIFTAKGLKSTSDFDESDSVIKVGEISDQTSDEKLAEIINKKEGKNYEVGTVARTVDEITEETRCFIGGLDSGDYEILNNRKNPIDILGDVDFRGCFFLTNLPENISFGWNVDFSYCTSLTNLPENISFGRETNFESCSSLTPKDKEKLRKMKENGEIPGKLSL